MVKVARKRWYQEHRDEQLLAKTVRHAALRIEALTRYGGVCVCCGESEQIFLCIDHVDGGGNAHRREIGQGSLYYWLRRNDWPEGYQVLCHNCNYATSHGGCPHVLRDLPPAPVITSLGGVESFFERVTA